MSLSAAEWGKAMNGLQCRLLPQEQTVEVPEGAKPEDVEVWLTYELRSVGEKPLKFLPWDTPLEEGIGGDILTVVGPEGKKAGCFRQALLAIDS